METSNQNITDQKETSNSTQHKLTRDMDADVSRSKLDVIRQIVLKNTAAQSLVVKREYVSYK